MYTDDVEAAYYTSRIKRSTALALASTDVCARLAHEGIANLYRRRLAAITPLVPPAPAFGRAS